MDLSKSLNHFSIKFGRQAEAVYFAPGRVNLIGEHIDYNGGFVMPAAISNGSYFLVAPNGTRDLVVFSSLFNQQHSFSLRDVPAMNPTGQWIDYIAGTLQQFHRRFGELPGMDVLVVSDLAQNSGLSSSASFSVGFAFALASEAGVDIDRVSVARVAQAVENDYVGVNCGIMDQFAVAMGKSDHCIALNCDSLEHELLPLNLLDHEIVIANSMVPRKLSESAYNQRRAECRIALETLQKCGDMDHLCAVTLEELGRCEPLKANHLLYRRAHHAVSEQQRVLESIELLKTGGLRAFGKLMNASHASLRDDFEVSCEELDILADTAQGLAGVLGSRMTGGGFGGCTVSIVASENVGNFIETLSHVYSAATPYQARILRCVAGDGVKRIQ